MIEAEREAGLKDGSLPKIHISGCMSSCGTHQIGEIGFHGSMKGIDKVAHSAFVLHINGSDLQGKEKMGRRSWDHFRRRYSTVLGKIRTGS